MSLAESAEFTFDATGVVAAKLGKTINSSESLIREVFPEPPGL